MQGCSTLWPTPTSGSTGSSRPPWFYQGSLRLVCLPQCATPLEKLAALAAAGHGSDSTPRTGAAHVCARSPGLTARRSRRRSRSGRRRQEASQEAPNWCASRGAKTEANAESCAICWVKQLQISLGTSAAPYGYRTRYGRPLTCARLCTCHDAWQTRVKVLCGYTIERGAQGITCGGLRSAVGILITHCSRASDADTCPLAR